jgi:hypothetical protein
MDKLGHEDVTFILTGAASVGAGGNRGADVEKGRVAFAAYQEGLC